MRKFIMDKYNLIAFAIGLIPTILLYLFPPDAAVPFWASFGAVAANTGLNYLLIFGKLGAPAMGVTGAAIATLVSQLLNLLLILIGFAVCLQKEAEHPLTVEI